MARQIPLSCSGHTRPVVDLSFSENTPYGYFLISACKDGKPMLRQGDTGDWIGTFEGHKGAVWSASLNKDATKAASGAADFTAKIWDAVTGDELASLPHKHIVKTVDFSSDSNYLLTGSQEKLIRTFDCQNTDADPEVLKGHTGNIRVARWNKDSSCIFSGGEDKVLRVWDIRALENTKNVELQHAITSMELSADGNILLLTYGKTVSFWNAHSMDLIKSFDTPTQVFSASLHPNKSCYVVGGEDFKLYKFDYENGNELESYKGHFGPVHCVRFSPDGELYASGSEDGTLRLWQNTVGTTYGLWRAVSATNGNSSSNSSNASGNS
ncbi:serine-threonine kinase receptor-associated protein-like [Actinia tenebrosa]|uniref:Serine-threonine kinase receptor-associated protein n=1 Tax=Actinia tenebrosa TaxID=6105 RepID=A0A6P8H9N1_ACTTE|nr:serine-threonine kinase receptor-associated protein-like [Actinia tenebrosa]